MPALATLSTDEVPARERVGYWSDLVWRSFGRLRSDTYGDPDFSGSIALAECGEVRVCHLQASRHRVVRAAPERGSSDPGHLKLVVQRRGRSLFEQDGRTAWLRSGDWSLYDTTKSYLVSAPVPVDLHILLLPREGLLRGRRELEQLLVRRLRASFGAGRLAASAIGQVLGEARAGRSPGPAAGEQILELLHRALREQADSSSAHRAALRERIKAHVEENLADPELRIESLARVLNCSKRALHKAFEDERCTLDGYIWDRRLEAARQALELARLERRSITSVAFANGFNSAAHFSRTFRARYGASPSEWHGRAPDPVSNTLPKERFS